MGIDMLLHDKEKVEEKLKPSHWVYLFWYSLGIILSLTIYGAIFGIPIILITIFVRNGHDYYITNRRVIHEFTFISRKISSVNYNRIQDIHLSQDLAERIFKIGSLHLNTAGSTHIELILKGIPNPRDIQKKITKHHK